MGDVDRRRPAQRQGGRLQRRIVRARDSKLQRRPAAVSNRHFCRRQIARIRRGRDPERRPAQHGEVRAQRLTGHLRHQQRAVAHRRCSREIVRARQHHGARAALHQSSSASDHARVGLGGSIPQHQKAASLNGQVARVSVRSRKRHHPAVAHNRQSSAAGNSAGERHISRRRIDRLRAAERHRHRHGLRVRRIVRQPPPQRQRGTAVGDGETAGGAVEGE